jgi:Molybdopterin-binding domain of aldehyde dehydrogenase
MPRTFARLNTGSAIGPPDMISYAVVHDCRTIFDTMIVEGRVIGGIAQGLSGALFACVVSDWPFAPPNIRCLINSAARTATA